MRMLVRSGLLVMVIGLMVSGCSIIDPPTCLEESDAYLHELTPLMEEWADTVDLANSTPRISLGSVISDLQEIKREVAALDPPDCAYKVHRAAIKMTEQSVTAFMAFSAQEDDDVVAEEYQKMVDYMSDYVEAYAELTQQELD